MSVIELRQAPGYEDRMQRQQDAQAAEEKALAREAVAEKRRLAAALAEAKRTRPQRRAALVRHHAAKRRNAKMHRTPAWADHEAIKAFYAEALRLTVETGEMHHVDHIYPLQGEMVSGLHVENNLQVLHWLANVQKHNRFEAEE